MKIRISNLAFLFSELVKRDFKKKYKRTILGMGWSMLMPICTLGVMYVVFSNLFGRNIEHFTTYLFCGNVVYGFFAESSKLGMQSLYSSASIFTKVNVPKYLFLLARNVQTLVNLGLTFLVFLGFCALDGIPFTWRLVFLAYPIATLLVFNIGVGLILSALYIFFRDMDYLWSVFLQLLMYGSAIFYPIDGLPQGMQTWFAWNPVYRHIAYFREITMAGVLPSLSTHLVLAAWSLGAFLIGAIVYKTTNRRFLYYV